ncbi:hypothetical protein HO173_001599 [Letharia columbiana]|uniref:Uncharacterized protein n=1 Tax=Letharia columbiana TaxID=112416 RepID=A0A8H6G3T1_9LECA|nr:uncharacterized protein HO173_001599 [Letharia columbiana]KAF6239991.1 hypothetical protein HO173_001599 [Letharia columbiana]
MDETYHCVRNSKGPHRVDPNVLEMHEDARPIELTYLALQELNEQSLQEMEQPGPLVELHAHEPSEIQLNKDYRGNGIFKPEILLLLSQLRNGDQDQSV